MLAAVAAVMAAWVSVSAEPQPAWAEPDAPLRAVFTRNDTNAVSLILLPARVGSAAVSEIRAWSGGARLPSRVVWADDRGVYVLVDKQGASTDRVIAVYALAGDQPAAPQPEGVVDPYPVLCVARRAYGQDPPDTVEQLRLVEARAEPPAKIVSLESFDAAQTNAALRQIGGNWERMTRIYRLTTWFFVPADGLWVFSFKGDPAAWLTVGGVPAVEQTYARGRKQWQAGQPLSLKRGLHAATLYTVGSVRHGAYDLSVTWRRVGSGQQAGNDLIPVTGGPLAEVRLERRAGDLHAFAQVTARGAPYRFLGSQAVFTPVKLRSSSVSWSGASLTCAWQDASGRPLGTGTEIDAVFSGTGQPVTVNLVVADSKGLSATDSTDVATDPVPAVEYGVSSRLRCVPAYCYGDDPVIPELHLRANSPDAIPFDVAAEIQYSSGRSTSVTSRVRLVRSWGRFVLPAADADEFSAIRWRVAHAGETIQTGGWIFDGAPFEALPDAVDGDSLRRGGEGVTFIARRASSGDVRRAAGLHSPEQRLLVIDGYLSSAAAGAAAPGGTDMDNLLATGLGVGRRVNYRRVSLKALESDEVATGVSGLMPFVHLASLLPADVAVLAPSLDSRLAGETLAAFERRLAALVGLICGPGRTSLILVAPPAFDILPGCGCVADESGRPCAHAREGRSLAECVLRVADAYGLPVADLFTPFMTAVSVDPLVKNGSLTPQGMDQAARVLQRVIYGRNGEP